MAQPDLFETAEARSLLDQLLDDSRLYRSSKDYLDLLNFVARLRKFAPFNAMLLHVQKPSIAYAATSRDWRDRFGRKPVARARPLLILVPFGPVALVYDLVDTEGRPVPEDAFSFNASGPMTERRLARMVTYLKKLSITCVYVDAGDRSAGSIRATRRATKERPKSEYEVTLNKNHAPAIQFATLAHELAHLYLGHLGADKVLKISDRRGAAHEQHELEAESVSYLVCIRNGVDSKSETYLAKYVDKHTTVDLIDLYQVMRAAGQIEGALGLTASEKEGTRRTLRNDEARARLARAKGADEDLSFNSKPYQSEVVEGTEEGSKFVFRPEAVAAWKAGKLRIS